MATTDVYDMANYYPFYQELGIFDLDSESRFSKKLKALSYSKVTTTNNELLDSLSHKIYGTEKLWWILAVYNDIVDPLNIGSIQLRSPSLDDVELLMVSSLEDKRKSS